MLSKRIIGSLIVKDGIVVQSVGFERYLPVGSPEIAVDFLNQWGIDEIIVLDIGEARLKRAPDFALLARLSKLSFVPLTMGGGVDTVEVMRELVHGGADKFVINQAAVETPQIIKEAARIFGNQCVVVSIDAKKTDTGYEVYIHGGQTPTGKDPVVFAKECAALGAGEILIRNVGKDGSKEGYDLELVRAGARAVDIPVIAAGGCGHPRHILEVFTNGEASAAAVGNFFHFTEHSVTTAKAYLEQAKIPVRLDTYTDYKNFTFDADGRIRKQDDAVLEKLRFEYQPKEVI